MHLRKNCILYYLGYPGSTVVENLPTSAGDERDVVQFLNWEDPLEQEMATYSSIPAWNTPRTEESGRLQSVELQRAGHDWASEHSHAHTVYIYNEPY